MAYFIQMSHFQQEGQFLNNLCYKQIYMHIETLPEKSRFSLHTRKSSLFAVLCLKITFIIWEQYIRNIRFSWRLVYTCHWLIIPDDVTTLWYSPAIFKFNKTSPFFFKYKSSF
jgi:hypothetical protein